MIKDYDPSIDWFADIPLTEEQRDTWNLLRCELIDAREKIKALNQRIKVLENDAKADDQSSILTRPEFNREVARMLAFDERYGGVSSVLYFNFDNLESLSTREDKTLYNVTIQEIGNLFMKNVRGSDVVGRLAFDEFGILLARCENSWAWKKGERLSSALYEGLKAIPNSSLDLGISYGAYTFRDHEDIAVGLKQAAQVMTKGKKGI